MKYAIIVDKVSKGFVDRAQLLPRWLTGAEIKKFYAVKGVSLKVKEGEIYGILGPNGCGKSTLIRMMATLLVPDRGRVLIKGHDVVINANKVKPLINRVSVDASFFKSLSARENLLYAGRLFGLEDKVTEERFLRILDEINFPKKLIDEPIRKCSRGQQQKVAIVRSFLSEPEVLLMDEPTTGLDPKSKKDVHTFIKDYMKAHEITIFLCSHDMDEIDRLCKKISVMDSGKILAEGTSKELKAMLGRKVYEIESETFLKVRKALESIKGISNIKAEDGTVGFEMDQKLSLQKLVIALEKKKVKYQSIHNVRVTLEDVFIELTGKTLGDEE